MYTQELICPSCGEVARVNVITSAQKKNPQSGRCEACSERIEFDVDSRGEIMDIREPSTSDSQSSRPSGNDREPRW